MRPSSIAFIALASVLNSTASIASDRTIWECRTANAAAEPILHLVEWGNRSYIKFSYMRFAAHYENREDHQAWYWHNDGSGYYRYGLVLGSDGRAWYHDFGQANGTEESTPLDYFVCNRDEED